MHFIFKCRHFLILLLPQASTHWHCAPSAAGLSNILLLFCALFGCRPQHAGNAGARLQLCCSWHICCPHLGKIRFKHCYFLILLLPQAS
jgi:hypothetical protein